MNIVSKHVLATLLSCAALGAVGGVALAADAPQSAAASAPAYQTPKSVPKYIRDAVESPSRSAEQKARDANRKPAEVLTLSGVKPGDRGPSSAPAPRAVRSSPLIPTPNTSWWTTTR